MTIYVVGYDLHPKKGETYENLENAIRSLGAWWHCLDSTWLIKSDLTSVQIRDELWKRMNSDDQLLVVAYAPHNSAWIGFAGNCASWLKDNM